MKKIIGILFVFTLILSGCELLDKITDPDSDPEPVNIKKSNFSEPDEYIENPSVKKAVSESGITINKGSTPPPLAGTYIANGSVVDASARLLTLKGMTIYSQIILYNQTTSGKIDFQEKVQNLTVWGSGGYITGNSGNFTIWQESRQSGDEAGLPDDITLTVVLLMSGNKLISGDLSASGISIITKVETNSSQYDVNAIEGSWWMWRADMELQTSSNAYNNKIISFQLNQTLQAIIKKAIISK
jgi:hypothetical protein